MPTSNSTNFSLNGTELMEAAMRLAGVLGIGQSVNSEMYNIAQQNLNIMMRHWENTGVRLWGIERGILFPSFGQALFQVPVVNAGVPSAYACLESDYRQNSLAADVAVGASAITLTDAVTFVAGDYIGIASDANGLEWFTVHAVAGQNVTLYTVGTTSAASVPYSATSGAIVVGFTTLAWMPLRIIEARRVDLTPGTSSVQVPMKICGKFDYERIPNKSTQSVPLWIYHQPRITWTDVYVWPTTGYANWAIGYSYERRYQDIDAGINSMDFPPEAYEALRCGLAARMGREVRIDAGRQQYLDGLAEQSFTVMRNATAGKASIKFGVAG